MWDPGMTVSILGKESHPHSSHAHSIFFLLTVTLAGCTWCRWQLVWACSAEVLAPSQGPRSSSFPKTRRLPHLRCVCQLVFPAAGSSGLGVVLGLLSAWSHPAEPCHALQHGSAEELTLHGYTAKNTSCLLSGEPQPPLSSRKIILLFSLTPLCGFSS